MVAVAEEKRTISMVADSDADIPEALRVIAVELEERGGELADLRISASELDGTSDPGGNYAGVQTPRPVRKNIRIEVDITSVIER